jgi:capsular exopolysaccharide synthesis family protein
MNLSEVLTALRAHWWLPVLGVIVGGGLALGISLVQTPLYTSSTQLFVSAAAPNSAAETFQGGWFTEQRATSYARLIAGEELADRVSKRLHLSPEAIRGKVTASATPGTVLIDVSVTDPSPERARVIAEAIGAEFPPMVDELESPSAGDPPLVRVTVTDPPELPTATSSPDFTRNIALGLAAGALIGAVGAVARVQLDRSVKNAEEATELAGAPVIGAVLRDAALDKRHTIDRMGDSRTAEDYRQLRNNLQFLDVDNPPRTIMVSSAVPSEGKTTLVINLGLALADAGQRIVIVEADLRRPKVTTYLGLVGGAGLTNVLSGRADLDDVIQRYGDELMSVLGGGPTPPNPGELLSSSQMRALLEKLRGQYDFVLVDAPPLLPVADASGLSPHVDGVLLSVRYGSTHKDQLREAAATVERVGGRTLGVVLNIVPPKAGAAAAYGYGYKYEAGKHAVS